MKAPLHFNTIWVALLLSHHHVGNTSSIVICINPLTSLKDQCAKLTSLGLTAAFIGEAQLNPLEKRKVIKGEVQMVYITHETLIGNPVYRVIAVMFVI